jgi:hypothetical protein
LFRFLGAHFAWRGRVGGHQSMLARSPTLKLRRER